MPRSKATLLCAPACLLSCSWCTALGRCSALALGDALLGECILKALVPGDPQTWLLCRVLTSAAQSHQTLPVWLWWGVFSMHVVGERLFSILILNFGLRRAEIACPALREAAVSCRRAPGCPCPEPCPYTSPSLVTAAQPSPSRSQTRRRPSRKLRDLCVETPFLNHVFFMCVVNTFLLLILKAKIYPLLIFVLF